MDTAPGGAVLFGHAEHAAGPDDRFAGATDDELTGLICGLDRAEAAACALKHAAVAELIRRNPEDGCVPEGPAQMPGTYDEFTEAELAAALAETRQAAGGILGWPMTWRPSCPAPGPRSGPGCYGCRRWRSLRARSPTWTPKRPAPPRRWCWTGPGG